MLLYLPATLVRVMDRELGPRGQVHADPTSHHGLGYGGIIDYVGAVNADCHYGEYGNGYWTSKGWSSYHDVASGGKVNGSLLSDYERPVNISGHGPRPSGPVS